MKQNIKLITVLTLLTTLLFSNSVFADGKVYTEGTLKYTISDDGNITIIDYFGKDETVKVPMSIGMHYVTEIAEGAFKDTNVKSVELPNTITSVAYDAFNDISSIQISYFDENDAQVEIQDPIQYPPLQPETPQEDVKPKEDTNSKQDDQIQIVVSDPFEETEGFAEGAISFEQADSDEPEIAQDVTDETEGEKVTESINQGESSVSNIEFKSNTMAIVAIVAAAIITIIVIKRKHK